MTIRPYRQDDLPGILSLFHDTVHTACAADYAPNQLSAWAPETPDTAAWEEKLCREMGIEYYHLRYFSVYGKGDHPWSIISTLTRELPLGHRVELSACRHRWNFMEVRDAARAVVLLYKNRSGSGSSMEGYDIVNIASEDTRVLREFTEEIHKLSGGKGELCYGEFIQAKEGPLSICPVTERLKLLTNGEFREEIAFSQGISELIEYNRNQDRT